MSATETSTTIDDRPRFDGAWEMKRLEECVSGRSNAIAGGPFGSDLVSADYQSSGVPVIRGQNMGGRCLSPPFAFVSEAKADQLSLNIARPNDLVFTQRGTVGQVSVVPRTPFPRYVVSQSQMRATLDERVADVEFVLQFFLSEPAQKDIDSRVIQTGIPHINLGILRQLPVTLPPLPEQRAIATVLSDVDDLLQSLDRLIAKKRDVKQGAMQQLLTGTTRLPGFKGAWKAKRLGEIAEIQMGQSPSSAHYNQRGEGLPLVQGNADIKNRRAIKRVFTTQITKRGKPGDLLMSVRAPVGEIATTDFEICLGRGVCAIRFPNPFLYHLLIFLEPMWARQSKGSTFDSVNSDDIRSTAIRMPEQEAEQRAIAAVLSDMDAEIDALEARRDKAAAIKQGMMQELLTGRTRLPIPQEVKA